jgi:fibronectin-binding autotransporter adhesin
VATKYKLNTGVALGTNTNWSLTSATVVNAPAAAPGAGDIAYWQASSLGPSLTGSISPDGIQVDGASANITHSSGIITVGSSGFTFASTNNRAWTETGTIAVGAVNQTWALANTAATTGINASTITGSSTINITNNTVGLNNTYAQLVVSGACAGFTGTLDFQNNTSLVVNATSTLSAADITISGTGTRIIPLLAAGGILNAAAKNLNINNDLTLGFTGRSFTIANAVNLGSSSRTITANGTTILSGAVTGSGALSISGSGDLRITGTAKAFSGSVDVSSGTLYLGDGNTTSNLLTSVPSINLSSNSSTLWLYSSVAGVYTNTMPITGIGNVYVQINNSTGSAGITFPSGFFSGYNNSSSTDGFGPYVSGSGDKTYIYLHEFPQKILFSSIATTTESAIAYINTSASPQTFNSEFYLKGTSNSIGSLYSNGTSPLILTGNFTCISTSTAMYLHLRGTNTGDNTISGNINSTPQDIYVNKNDAGRWVLSGNNTYGGTTVITAGTLVAASGGATSGALGGISSLGDITIATAGTLEIQGGITLTKSTSTVSITGNASNPSIYVTSGDNTFTTSTVTLATTDPIIDIASSASLTMSAALNGTSRAIIKKGAGTLNLTNAASGFTGTPVIQNGTIGVGTISTASGSLGTSTGITFGLAGTTNNVTLKHIGTSANTSNKNFTFNSNAGSTFTIDSSGTSAGALTLGGTITISQTGAHTLEFSGTNTATNTISSTIPDSAATGATAITKSGSNTWSLTGTINATGLVSCTSGTLNLGSTNRTFSGGLSISGGTVTITSGNTISANTTISGGAITAVLTGANTITVTSSATELAPATLQPDDTTNGNNTLTGSVSINGCIDLVTPNALDITTTGKGRVLGNSNTATVSSTGIIRTKGSISSSQNGSARYNILNLQADSKLKIGFAA